MCSRHLQQVSTPNKSYAADITEPNLIDSNTSDGSTSPFSGPQIEEFLNILKSFKSDPDEFQTFTVGE